MPYIRDATEGDIDQFKVASNRIRLLRGYVLSSNKPMIKLLERYNPEYIMTENGTLQYDLHLT